MQNLTTWDVAWLLANLLVVGYFLVQLVARLVLPASDQEFNEFVIREGRDVLLERIGIPYIGAAGGGLMGVALTETLSLSATALERSLAIVLFFAATCFIIYAPIKLSNDLKRSTPPNIPAEVHRLQAEPGTTQDKQALEKRLQALIHQQGNKRKLWFGAYLAMMVVVVVADTAWLINRPTPAVLGVSTVVACSAAIVVLGIVAMGLRRSYYCRLRGNQDALFVAIRSLPIHTAPIRQADVTAEEPTNLATSALVVAALGVATGWLLHRRQVQ